MKSVLLMALLISGSSWADVPAGTAPAPTPSVVAPPVPQPGSPAGGILPQPSPIPPSASTARSTPVVPRVVDPPSFPTKPGTSAVDYKKFRDPFKEPVLLESLEIRGDLERYAVTDFKVTGIITGPVRMRAMILAPDGKTHYVAEKMKLGLRDGVIIKITTKTILVREKVVNPLGEVELFDTEIGMDQVNANNSDF